MILSLGTLIPLYSYAEQVKDFGKYHVHYNALDTTFLSAKVANEYGIKRSKNRMMLNISIQEKMENTSQNPVSAAVWASATNLTGQLKQISIRPVHEGEAIYYIGELSVADKETLDFTVNIQPANTKETLTLKFRQQFFTR
jgi:hypothetical protein